MKFFFPDLTIRIFVIISLLTFVSCTVTKRVYNKGYYIEWNKNYSKSSTKHRVKIGDGKAEKAKDLTSANQMVYEDLDSLSDYFVEQSNESSLNSSDEDYSQGKSMPSFTENIYQNNSGYSVTENTKITLSKEEIHQSNEESTDTQSDSNLDMLETIGAAMIGLGLLLIIGSLFLFFGFNGLGGLFDSLVFSGNGFVTGLFGFILFIFIVLIVLLSVVLVELVLGGYMTGFIAGFSLIAVGSILMLIHYLFER